MKTDCSVFSVSGDYAAPQVQVIFCQMRNDNQTLSWGAKKNQTVDLTIPADNNVLFVVETPWGDESNGWKATGRWSAL